MDYPAIARHKVVFGWGCGCSIALCLGITASVEAHDVSRSESRLTIIGTTVRAVLTLDLLEVQGVDRNADGRISYDELDDSLERIYAGIKAHFLVRGAAPPMRTTVERYDVIDDHVLRLDLLYEFEQIPTRVEVTSSLDRMTQPAHLHLTRLTVSGKVQDAVLDARTPTIVFSAGGPSYGGTAVSFLRRGLDQIVTRYSYLTFLVGLLLATATRGSLIKVLASFAVAHSLTLALATFDVVSLPPRLTESAIAVSIAYVAVENLLRSGAIERSRMTFLFGLVHGFGFSNVLRDVQLPRASMVLSLVSFNAGIEIGLMLLVVLTFPLVDSSPWRSVRPPVSIGLACLAAYWFVQRAFLT